MFGNGARIGMEDIAVNHRQIQKVQGVGLTAWAVAVAGTSMRGTVALRTVTTTALASGAATLGSALPSPSNNTFRASAHSGCSKLRGERNEHSTQ